mmetsp:Transcript_54775/g.116390  ORF Transcript_54775/g.116390 Transcript_54775/m.116390 type:complete len:219 (-) Transcript_54775:118-774(-)
MDFLGGLHPVLIVAPNGEFSICMVAEKEGKHGLVHFGLIFQIGKKCLCTSTHAGEAVEGKPEDTIKFGIFINVSQSIGGVHHRKLLMLHGIIFTDGHRVQSKPSVDVTAPIHNMEDGLGARSYLGVGSRGRHDVRILGGAIARVGRAGQSRDPEVGGARVEHDVERSGRSSDLEPAVILGVREVAKDDVLLGMRGAATTKLAPHGRDAEGEGRRLDGR